MKKDSFERGALGGKGDFSPCVLEKSDSLRLLDNEVYAAIVNQYGAPRLSACRSLLLPLTQYKIPLLKEVFQYWQDYDEYMLLLGTNQETDEQVRCAVKCSKRGNDVYAKRLEKKLGFLNDVQDATFFKDVDFNKQAYADCNLLWITLSFDSKLCSLDEAWRNSYRLLHKFKANLENKYGKLQWMVFPQPSPDSSGKAYGFPHFHGVLFFKETKFKAFPRLEKDKQGRTVLRYRIKEKRELEAQGKWHSFIDVQAMSSVKGAVNYVRKYAQGVCYGDSEKAVLNSAVLWLYRKKSYSLTRGFQKTLHDLMVSMQARKNFMQLNLQQEKAYSIWEWKFYGIRGFFDIRAVMDGEASSDCWVFSFSRDQFQRLVDAHSSPAPKLREGSRDVHPRDDEVEINVEHSLKAIKERNPSMSDWMVEFCRKK